MSVAEAAHEAVLAHFRRFLPPRLARVEDLGAGARLLTLVGPRAGETVAAAFGAAPAAGFALPGDGPLGGGTLVMGQSLVPDTIEYDFRRTGLRREGIFAGVFTTVEKFAYAFAPAITGIFLGAMGYVSSTGDVDAAQPDSAILAIYIAVAIVPSVMSAGNATPSG